MALLELSTDLLVELGGWPALKEARGLVERGKVTEATQAGNSIRARVQGPEKSYEPQIILADRISQVEVRCTCVESRRSGKVCAHALAAGWAVLHPASVKTAAPPRVAAPTADSVSTRWPSADEAGVAPAVECTILLPLQLREALGQPASRIILEARLAANGDTAPWETVTRGLAARFPISEEDARVLSVLEKICGAVAGLNSVPRARAAELLRALSGHPRVWLGKKQRIEVRGTEDRNVVLLHRREDGALVLDAADGDGRSSSRELALPGWNFDGALLKESAVLPAGFHQGRRIIPRAGIPDFLASEWPALERACEVRFPAGFEEFSLETGRPSFEAQLDGALSGLTLTLLARYGGRTFPVSAGGTPSAYFEDPDQMHRFWRRNAPAEKTARLQVEAAGFSRMRSGAASYSLIQENQVARFLANTLPRLRREWAVTFGSRLAATMEQIDVAQPEFMLRGGSGEDWLNLDLKLAVRGAAVPLAPAEIQRWLQTGQNHARTANRRVLLIPTEAWGEMREVLADCEVDQEPGRMRVARTYAPFLTGALTAQGFQEGGDRMRERRAPNVEEKIAPSLWTQLRPYQKAGVAWLAALADQKFSGLLADDMGLGKTIQALVFCAWLCAVRNQHAPILVVCPTSLVTNWQREAARFVPNLRTLDLTGSERAGRFSEIGTSDLLITSYAILRRDAERFRALEFSLVILDEAQHIKNRGSRNAQAAKALRSQHRLILTGTPLENSILDLWSLFDFLLPGYLGKATEFKERYETPLTRGIDARAMERLRHRVRPFLLRRTKEEVLPELPPKLEFPTLCALSHEQTEVYRAILAQGRRDVFDRAGKAGQGRDRLAVLTTLLRLRQVCCHLDLLPQDGEKRAWKEPSTKLERTFELIDEAIDGGHRVLLFSQFVRVLHLLRDEAQRRQMPFAYLDGQTAERQREVDRFQGDAGIPLFLISLKAGGTGLNLTGADTVIHFDPWWNPAVEEQATARAHRLGQARSVQAYKLIAAGTVEEKIQSLQARKRELFQASVGGDEALVNALSGDELEELLAEPG